VSGRAVFVSDLADDYVVDLRAVERPYCTMLREVWQEVPYVWENGQVALRPAPANHPCGTDPPQ